MCQRRSEQSLDLHHFPLHSSFSRQQSRNEALGAFPGVNLCNKGDLTHRAAPGNSQKSKFIPFSRKRHLSAAFLFFFLSFFGLFLGGGGGSSLHLPDVEKLRMEELWAGTSLAGNLGRIKAALKIATPPLLFIPPLFPNFSRTFPPKEHPRTATASFFLFKPQNQPNLGRIHFSLS